MSQKQSVFHFIIPTTKLLKYTKLFLLSVLYNKSVHSFRSFIQFISFDYELWKSLKLFVSFGEYETQFKDMQMYWQSLYRFL